MRWVPRIVQAIIVAIALYFVLFWGCEAAWSLTAQNFGLDDAGRAQAVRALGRLLDLGRSDLVRLAAFVAAFKLTAVAAFAIHLIGRARATPGSTASHDILEAALLLVVILTAAVAVAAVGENNGALIRNCAAELFLAGVAAILSAIERIGVALRRPGRDAAPRAAVATPAGTQAIKRVSSWRQR
jgi:hypothetical protein